MVIAVYIVVLVAAFFFLIVLPQRRRMAAHQALMATLQLGDEVITSSGIYGTIRSLGDATIDLEIATGVTITIARGAIAQRIVNDPDLPELERDDTDGEALSG
jgi:preprotein translocase subunit YajC